MDKKLLIILRKKFISDLNVKIIVSLLLILSINYLYLILNKYIENDKYDIIYSGKIEIFFDMILLSMNQKINFFYDNTKLLLTGIDSLFLDFNPRGVIHYFYVSIKGSGESNHYIKEIFYYYNLKYFIVSIFSAILIYYYDIKFNKKATFLVVIIGLLIVGSTLSFKIKGQDNSFFLQGITLTIPFVFNLLLHFICNNKKIFIILSILYSMSGIGSDFLMFFVTFANIICISVISVCAYLLEKEGENKFYVIIIVVMLLLIFPLYICPVINFICFNFFKNINLLKVIIIEQYQDIFIYITMLVFSYLFCKKSLDIFYKKDPLMLVILMWLLIFLNMPIIMFIFPACLFILLNAISEYEYSFKYYCNNVFDSITLFIIFIILSYLI